MLSCDNLPDNGDVARRMLCAFAERVDPDLAAWIDMNVEFPNCMVDRITPATTAEDIALLSDDYGIDDAWPVVCEPWTQWVLEDHFSNGRPPWERVGVQLADYRASLIDRFSSPAVKDPLARLCAETSDRIPQFLLPVLEDNLEAGGDIDRAVLVVAAWARYCEGRDEQGQKIEVIDPLRDELTAAAARHDSDLTAFLDCDFVC